MSLDVWVNADWSSVHRAMGKLLRTGRDMTPIFRDARRPLLRDQTEHRKKQEAPEGRWPRRSAATVARVRAKSRKSGRRRAGRVLGKLPSAFKLIVERRRLAIVSRVKWSGVHQDGAGRTGRAPKIPKRTFFWVSRRGLREIQAVFVTHLEKSWP